MQPVVLADPDSERRAASVFALRSGSLEVLDTDTLEGALTAVASDQPRALVLAAELCRVITPARLSAALKAQPETEHIRLVVVAAIDTGVDTDGADVVLSRPATSVDLVRAVLGDEATSQAS